MRIVKILTVFFVLAAAAFSAALPGGCANKKPETTNISQATEISKTTETTETTEATEISQTTEATEISQTAEISQTTEITETKTEETSPEITEPPAEPEARLTGYHRREYENGDVYTGYFADGVRSGQGTYTWANGIIYTGEWIEGEPGEGEYIYPAENPPGQPDHAESPDPDFIRYMRSFAVEIPGSGEKIEQPPQGRSLELQYAAVPFCADIPEPFGYFRDIIFLGDSVTMGFEIYKNRITYNGEAVLKDAAVISSGSYGVYRSAEEISDKSIHPLLDGKQTLPEDIIAQKENKYVLICLGLNDVGMMTVERYIEYYEYLIDRIKYKNPEKTIVIMSITPIVYEGQKQRLNNSTITEANNALLELAKRRDIPFIDYAAALRDSQNNFYSELSGDAYCHLTLIAYNRLVEYLLNHPLRGGG